MTPQYERADAVFYDLYAIGIPGDSQFYVEEAKKAGSPVLELGCGTGRTLIPIAQAGVDIVGVDLSEKMLDIAKRNISELSEGVQNRIELAKADMRSFALDRQFRLVTIPYRAFLHLMTTDDQKQALWRIRDHLVDGGLLALNIFDPRLDFIVQDLTHPEPALRKHGEFIRPDNGNRVVIWDAIKYDLEKQIINEDRVFEEIDGAGNVVSKSYSALHLRFIYRYEMQHLLELCGFKIEAFYGDFKRGPFRYGGEQVWVARKA
jgi:SAM-dependent methyltransferase